MAKFAVWSISGATWSGHETEVEVTHGVMTEQQMVEFATALLDEAARVHRMKNDRRRMAREEREEATELRSVRPGRSV